MNINAKLILKAIKKKAKAAETYCVISSTFLPHLNRWQYAAEQLGCNEDLWKEIVELDRRHESFTHYLQEVKPQWREVDRFYYADNSVEAVQVNSSGEQRSVLLTGPSGDACY